MNKAFLLIISAAVFLASSCAVTSDKYRYQVRIDRFLNQLNDPEKAFFRDNALEKVGESLENRMKTDQKLAAEFRSMQEYEAITAFNPYQVAHFFRYTLLRELNRDNFYRFMNLLDAGGQAAFARNSAEFPQTLESLYKTDGRMRGFIDNLRAEYRLYNYSFKQITGFYRDVSFPEVSRKRLFGLLSVLKKADAFNEFKGGQLAQAADKLDKAVKDGSGLDMEVDEVKKLSSLTKLDTSAFLDIYYNVIAKEMDQEAVNKTFAKFVQPVVIKP